VNYPGQTFIPFESWRRRYLAGISINKT